MKTAIISYLSAVVITTTPLLAESPAEHDFKQLSDQYTKATAAAIKPINDRYSQALESLLRKAMQTNDIAAATKIKEAIDTLATPAMQEAAIAKEVKSYFVNTTWANQAMEITFRPDGTATRKAAGTTFPVKWKMEPDGTVVTTNHVGGVRYYFFKSREQAETAEGNKDAAREPISRKK